MDAPVPEYWRKCTTCKKPIPFNTKYWICSVSTCNRQRTGLVFCSVSCFDAHIPVMNHRDAGAYEKRSPTQAEWKREQEAAAAPPAPREARPTSPGSAPPPRAPAPARAPDDPNAIEILVVVSKVKAYIRERAGMNTSDSVMRLLTRFVEAEARNAIRRAEQDGRQTVLDRDVR